MQPHLRHNSRWLVALAAGLAAALCLACLMPSLVAGGLRSRGGPHGYVADVCVGVRYFKHVQVGVGWISSQASATIARPSPYYWRPRTALCLYVPWSPLLREQGGIAFPPA